MASSHHSSILFSPRPLCCFLLVSPTNSFPSPNNPVPPDSLEAWSLKGYTLSSLDISLIELLVSSDISVCCFHWQRRHRHLWQTRNRRWCLGWCLARKRWLCAPCFFLGGHVLTEITARETRMRYTLTSECSSFFAPSKLISQDHF